MTGGIFLFLFLFGLQGSAHGQGKLGKIRNAVRQEAPKRETPQKSTNPKPKKEDRSRGRDDNHGGRSDDNRHRRRNQTQRRNQNQRHHRNHRRNNDLGLALSLNNFLTPVVEEIHVVHHSPQPRYVTPRPMSPLAPMAPLAMEPIIPAPPIEATNVGQDFFPIDGSSSPWCARISMQAGTDFEDLTLGSLGLLLQDPGGLGLDTSVTMFRESGVDFRDNLYLGDVNLVFEPVAIDQFRLRVGIGVNWLGDSYGGEAGFNMTTGFDWNLAPRWWVTGEVDLGTIGDTDLTHAQISLGRSLGQSTTWTIGYDYHDIGGVTIGSAFTGLQFRF